LSGAAATRAQAGAAVLGAAVLLGACSGGYSLAPVAESGTAADHRSSAAAARPTHHTVRRGDTLYAIAWRYGLDYRSVAEWNRITPPYLIYPGQKVRVVPLPGSAPGARRRAQERTAAAPAADAIAKAPSPAGSRPAAKRPGAAESTPPRSTASASTSARAVDGWRWPTRGTLLAKYSSTGSKGVDIGGRIGQPIVAAADGRVVYSGGGLIGYGELIIIKHDRRFLSAYAHNNKLLVKEGDEVEGGQEIALMGSTGTDRPKLHFEIRRDGKPVDPLAYLPR